MSKGRHDSGDRLFVKDGWRHYRRRYAMAEVRWGLAVLAVLVCVGGWVAYRGAHPDPTLFAATVAGSKGATTQGERGPFPKALASEGWRTGPFSQFTAETLYEKINGRADYFEAFGFRRLYAVSLTRTPTRAVDLELYDLGSAANALGAYAGEKSADVEPKLSTGGMGHLARNALLLTRGRYYLRAIGTDESEPIQEQLHHLRRLFENSLPGEPLPWGYGLFVGLVGVAPAKVVYITENAFSLAFARDVYVARLAGDGEAFAVARGSATEAQQLARRFAEGFAGIGREVARDGEVAWIEENYLETLSAARAVERWVVGVRRMQDLAAGRELIEQLADAIGKMPADLRDRARPKSTTDTTSDSRGYEP